ncbi:putative ATP/GTP-binding protein [Janibacter sp. HTCC2649]|uniref:FG-GAP repeat domain-containing protein n=1 Tax=Janibacter sp. HTCC2649 TaxID=313589 RepID=UPI0000670AA0|nr:VCBS repeat-containing protein [Janibacter sp. HTCC2649]EAQ00418.1 putative ATP/GTP-binding protein [Janibacter sp. HTCC2649]
MALLPGLGGGLFGKTGLSHISADFAPLPGSATGRGPGAPLGAMYLSGSSLVEPTPGDPRVIGKGFNIFRTIDASSDLTGDAIADLIGITPAGDFYLYTSTSTGAIGRGVRLGSGWGAFHTVFSPGDFNGDTRSDLVAVDGLGKLWLYPGNGRGGFGARVGIGTGWAGFGSVLPMRDFSGDGKVDIGAITTDGKLRMYPGNGRGGFLTSSQIGTGWGIFL